MIKSISYWSMEHGLAGTHPIADAVSLAADAGFDGIELCIGTEGVLSVETTQRECEAIRSVVQEKGLDHSTLASGMSWAFNPTSNDPEARGKAIDLHTAALERAAWLGCQAMLFVPGVVNSPIAPDEHIRYDHAVDRARDAVYELLEAAERVGVDLCLENVWNGLFYSPLEWVSFIDSFGSDRLGMYFDVGNCMGYQQHPPHWVELLGERIKRVHIKDFAHQFDWNGTYSFCDLLEGDVPFEETIAALQAVGYDKTVVAEMLPHKPGLLEHTSVAMDKILGHVCTTS